MLFHSNSIVIRFGVAVLSFLLIATMSFGEISSEDLAFLEDLQKRGVRFFWEEANPRNGLIYDRARYDASEYPHGRVASIAAVGFGLTALCIGQERGWIGAREAYERVRTTLRYLRYDMPNVRGFYYHFVNIETGEREWNSELSSIDTALLIAGVLTARQYYRGTEVERLATEIYERVDWPWMLQGGIFSMGWKPESGFLPYHWNNYSEHLILYLLAMGSPTHPIAPEVWYRWRRAPVINYGGRVFLACPPLFTHQYSQIWFDFRNQRDAYADYHLNTILATRAQRQMFMDLSGSHPEYGADLWGLTASDSPHGYIAWGGPPETGIDGTVTPYAAGGAIAFTPEEALHTLRYMRDQYGESIWGDYAFSVAINPHTGWAADDVIGIDIGVTVLSAENYRSGFVWDTFMQNPEIQRAMRLAGFRDIAPDVSDADRDYLETLASDTWTSIDQLVHAASGLPHPDSTQPAETSLTDIGLHLTALVSAHKLELLTRDEALQRITTILDSVIRFETWMGFPAHWNNVADLAPSSADTWISPRGAAILAAGLITTARAFPETEDTVRPLIEAMEWERFLEADRNLLIDGYDHKTEMLDTERVLSDLSSDGRMAVFLAIASGRVSPDTWNAMNRATVDRHHIQYLEPGWERGQYFMAFLPGLWMDEQGTLAHQSARNLAYAQMRHADHIRSRVWGWSHSPSPRGRDGVLDRIVTPYASVLALGHYPNPVVANLRALEILGARHPERGFFETVDVRTRTPQEYFVHRHQCMILIALANYVKDNVIRGYFESDLQVLMGRHRIDELRDPPFGGERSLFTLQHPPLDIR